MVVAARVWGACVCVFALYAVALVAAGAARTRMPFAAFVFMAQRVVSRSSVYFAPFLFMGWAAFAVTAVARCVVLINVTRFIMRV